MLEPVEEFLEWEAEDSLELSAVEASVDVPDELPESSLMWTSSFSRTG